MANTNGKAATLILPNATGGANWEGGAFDPETKIAYIFSTTNVRQLSLINDPSRSNMDYILGGGGGGGRGAGDDDGGQPAAAGRGGGGGRGAARGEEPAGGAAPAAPARGGGLPPTTVFGLPLIKPPYGRVTAIK